MVGKTGQILRAKVSAPFAHRGFSRAQTAGDVLADLTAPGSQDDAGTEGHMVLSRARTRPGKQRLLIFVTQLGRLGHAARGSLLAIGNIRMDLDEHEYITIFFK